MNFSKTAFNSRTKVLLVDARDEASGNQYTLNGKLEGTEIKGTVTGENLAGPVNLIKWTYVPPMQW